MGRSSRRRPRHGARSCRCCAIDYPMAHAVRLPLLGALGVDPRDGGFFEGADGAVHRRKSRPRDTGAIAGTCDAWRLNRSLSALRQSIDEARGQSPADQDGLRINQTIDGQK